jgi:hypothetical protein
VTASPGGTAAAALQGVGNARVTVTNLGGGTVASADGAIQCGTQCSVPFTTAPVVLTATPDAAHDFAGWSGACTATSGTCTLPLGMAESAVTATFALKPAALTLDPASKDLGAVTLGGQSGSFDFTVTNSGAATSGPIAASVTDAADYTITGGTCAAGLSGGASCKVSVRFNPTGQSGIKPATLDVTATPGGHVSSSLTGSALTAGALTLSQMSKDFGPQALGSASDETSFTVTNSGESATSTPIVSLSDTSNFVLSSNTCTGPLDGGGTCTVGVKIAPQSIGPKSGSLVVSVTGSNATASLTGAGAAQLTVTAVGSGTVISGDGAIGCSTACSATFTSAPTLTATPGPGYAFTGWSGGSCSGTAGCTPALSAATNTVSATFTIIPAALTISPSSAAFGSITVDQTSAGIDFTVKNSGGASTAAIGISVDDNNFVASGSCAGAQLGSNKTCTVTVQFAPLSVGAHSATVTVGDPSASARASLTGTGLSKGNLVFTPASLDFMNVPILGQSAEQTLTLKNTGGSPTGTLAAPVLSDLTNFTISSNSCPSVLAAGATCTIGVKLTPKTVDLHYGSVTVPVTPGASALAALLGTGTAQVTVTNAGGGTVTSQPAGLNCGAACVATFSSNPLLSATADGAHVFAGWSGSGCSGTEYYCQPSLSAANNPVTASFVTPASLTFVDTYPKDFGNQAIQSASAEVGFTLKNTGGAPSGTPGAPALSDPSFIVSSNGCTSSLAPGATCVIGVKFQPQTVGARTGVTLSVNAWPGGTASNSTMQGTGTAQVTVINGGGGTVTSSERPPTLSCGATCTATYTASPVDLTATPDGTHAFVGWSGNPSCSGTGKCSLPLGTATSSVTASFAALTAADLQASSIGTMDFGLMTLGVASPPMQVSIKNNGQLRSNPLSVSIDSSEFTLSNDSCTNAWLDADQSCTLQVTFKPTSVGARSATLTVSAQGASSATAALAGSGRATVSVNIHPSSSSGTVTSSPSGISCPGSTCSADFTSTPVRLTASPTSGYYFSGWSGGACSGTGPTCSLNAINSSPTTCTATFAACETQCPYECGSWTNSCGKKVNCGLCDISNGESCDVENHVCVVNP